MTDISERPASRISLWLMIAGLVTALMAAAVVFIVVSRPHQVVLEISEPVGEPVRVDLNVDGVPDTRIDTPPFVFQYVARSVNFAVIPVVETTSDVKLNLRVDSSITGMSGSGVTGWVAKSRWSGHSQVKPMTSTHVSTMRAAIKQQPIEQQEPTPTE